MEWYAIHHTRWFCTSKFIHSLYVCKVILWFHSIAVRFKPQIIYTHAHAHGRKRLRLRLLIKLGWPINQFKRIVLVGVCDTSMLWSSIPLLKIATHHTKLVYHTYWNCFTYVYFIPIIIHFSMPVMYVILPLFIFWLRLVFQPLYFSTVTPCLHQIERQMCDVKLLLTRNMATPH